MGLQDTKTERGLLEPQYYRLPLNLYRAGDIIQHDLFFLYQGNYLLYRLKNLIWKNEDTEKLRQFEVDHLYIKCSTPRAHSQFLEGRLKSLLEQDNITSAEKAEIVYTTTSSLMEELFEQPSSPETLKRSMGAVQNSIQFLAKDKKHFFLLMEMATNQFSEFTHSLHTAAYSISLAKEMGMRAFNSLSPLGVSAILHDIGKTKIPKEILEKKDPLSEEERSLVQTHPEEGFEIVRKTRLLAPLAETIILQHHERPSGKGYPHGLNDIDLHSQIVGLCDCYDSLTSNLSYQKAMKPFEAIQYIRNELKDEFNSDLITHLIKMLKRE